MSDKQTIEAWAAQKGMLPELLPATGRIGSREVPTKRANPRYVQFARAKAHRRWPEGKEVTEHEFDEAVAEANGIGLT